MKELKDTIASAVAAASADTVNAEGAPAWTMRDADRLVQLAMTGTMGNAFYASAQEVTADAVRLLERAEPRALADAIVRGRNEGFVRAFPLLGLVYLSLKDPALFRETFPKVVLTGGDLGDFVDLARRVRGLGRGVKAAMAAWLAGKTTPYYAQKYRAQLADAVRLCRFRGEDPVFAWILASRDGAKGVTPERIAAAEAAHPALAARRDFIRAVESGDEEAALRLLRSEALDLDSLSNWNDRFTPAMWRAAARRMPAMRFLKSLGKLLRENALEEETFREKISVERLRAAKVFPFRLYAAWAALESPAAWAPMPRRPELPPEPRPASEDFSVRPFASLLADGSMGQAEASALLKRRKAWREECDRLLAEHDRQCILAKARRDAIESTAAAARDHLAATLDAYARAFDWGAFNRGSWVVAPDVSGSMVSPIAGSAHLRFTEVSGMFTGFFSAGLEKVTVIPFDTQAQSYGLGREASVLDHVRAIGKMTGGGTYLEAPILEMLRKGIDADNALFITDSEEWGKGWLGLWKQYRRRNPAAKAFLLRLDSYRTQPFPPDEAESLGIHQIFGWSDAVVDYMRLALEN